MNNLRSIRKTAAEVSLACLITGTGLGMYSAYYQSGLWNYQHNRIVNQEGTFRQCENIPVPERFKPVDCNTQEITTYVAATIGTMGTYPIAKRILTGRWVPERTYK
jgi:hypothetical protein